MVFSKKNILIPTVAEQNIQILVEEKKKSDSEFLSYNLIENNDIPIIIRSYIVFTDGLQ
jgi:hypothetical protein